ncbi:MULTISPECIES: alpha/beta fold hydrolase [unclassified Legionella]|uniref:alpha/beta fold hydrolase n=1 Tax=unclassified Legionella TaxID=2622702 RepID=UPI0010543020|nr:MULTISPECIES: alpha/beta fold hydrolase [unclassified Legionella]MDI9818802.1 alpha/beta fold hydrolase [Legionella sp. PL877]
MKLNIEIRGRGPALVLFHGWGFDHKIWLPLANQMDSCYSLFLVDLPGFGASSLMNWTDFKQNLLQQLPDCFASIGWSMGGLFATRLALEASERVSHLVNIASSPRFIREDNWPGVDKIIFNNFLNNLTGNPRQTLSQFIRLQSNNQDYIYPDESIPEVDSLQAGLEILANWDLRQSLAGFNKPTCYMFGNLDAITPRLTMPAMQKTYPDFHYILFKKAAHMPFLSHQDEFINQLKQVLE